MRNLIRFLLRLERRKLEKRIGKGWNRELSLDLDKVLAAQEALQSEPSQEYAA